jgi:BirA family biotin operon repressor/biotin-[acetyl-CoA-carboxylase] ligase
MLAEMEADSDRMAWVSIGIGLNVNNDPVLATREATSIRRLLGRPASRRDILTELLDRLERRLDDGRLEGVVDEWKAISCSLGRPVRVATFDEVHQGVAEDVDADGALVIRQPDGSIRRVIHGDCFHA